MSRSVLSSTAAEVVAFLKISSSGFGASAVTHWRTPPWSGKVAQRRSGAHFPIEVRLALDAPSDDEAELDGVRNESGDPEVRLLECDLSALVRVRCW